MMITSDTDTQQLELFRAAVETAIKKRVEKQKMEIKMVKMKMKKGKE
jgi:hypothetical protein